MRILPPLVLLSLAALAAPSLAASAQGLTVVEPVWDRPLWGSVGGLAWWPGAGALAAGTGTGSVFAVSPDGRGLWTRGVGATVTALAPSGDLLLVGTDSGLLAAYDGSGSVAWTVDVGSPVGSLVPVPGGWAVAAGGGLILVAANGSAESVNLSSPVRLLLSCGGLLAAAGDDLILVNLSEPAEAARVDLPEPASALACGPSGGLAAGGGRGSLTVMDGNSTLRFDLGSGVGALSWSREDLLAAGLEDGRIVVLTPSGEEAWSSTAPSPASVLSWDPSGSLLAAGGSSGWFSVYTSAGTPSAPVDLEDPVRALSWSENGSLLAVGTWDLRVFRVTRPGFELVASPSPDGSSLRVEVSVSPPLSSPLDCEVSAEESGRRVAGAGLRLSGSGAAALLNLSLPPGDHALVVRLLVSGEEAASAVAEVSVPPEVRGSASWDQERGRLKVDLAVSGAPLRGRLSVSESGGELASLDLDLPEGERTLYVPLDLPPGEHDLSVSVSGRWGALWGVEVAAVVREISLSASPLSSGGGISVTVGLDPPPPGPVDLELSVSEGGSEVWGGRVEVSSRPATLEVPLDLPPGEHDLSVSASGAGARASTRVRLEVRPSPLELAPYAAAAAGAAAAGFALLRVRRRSADAELKVRILEAALEGGGLTPEEVSARLGISRARAKRLLEELRREGSLEG